MSYRRSDNRHRRPASPRVSSAVCVTLDRQVCFAIGVMQGVLQGLYLQGLTHATERNAYAEAANILGQSPEHIKLAIAELGRSVNGPWRADQKMAALAAWVSLR